MGIGRRDFIRLTSLALAGLAIDPLQAVVTNNNFYINRKLGVLFNIPSGWGFVAVQDFGRLKNEQILGSGLDEFKDEIWEDLGSPICVATKYYQDLPEHKGVFSPTITMNVTPKHELECLGCASFDDLIAQSEEGVSMLLQGFEVIKRHDPYLISGCKFYEFDAQYIFDHIELSEPITVELKVLKAEHNGFYYDFNCHQSRSQNQIADGDFETFKQSIQLI